MVLQEVIVEDIFQTTNLFNGTDDVDTALSTMDDNLSENGIAEKLAEFFRETYEMTDDELDEVKDTIIALAHRIAEENE